MAADLPTCPQRGARAHGHRQCVALRQSGGVRVPCRGQCQRSGNAARPDRCLAGVEEPRALRRVERNERKPLAWSRRADSTPGRCWTTRRRAYRSRRMRRVRVWTPTGSGRSGEGRLPLRGVRTRFARPARRRVALGRARGREPCPSRHASQALGTKEAEVPRATAARAQAQARAAQPSLRPSASTRALLQLSVSTGSTDECATRRTGSAEDAVALAA